MPCWLISVFIVDHPVILNFSLTTLFLLAVCQEGYEYDNDTEECRECLIGFYKEYNSSDLSVDFADRWWCKGCPDDETTLNNATDDDNKCRGMSQIQTLVFISLHRSVSHLLNGNRNAYSLWLLVVQNMYRLYNNICF